MLEVSCVSFQRHSIPTQIEIYYAIYSFFTCVIHIFLSFAIFNYQYILEYSFPILFFPVLDEYIIVDSTSTPLMDVNSCYQSLLILMVKQIMINQILYVSKCILDKP